MSANHALDIFGNIFAEVDLFQVVLSVPHLSGCDAVWATHSIKTQFD